MHEVHHQQGETKDCEFLHARINELLDITQPSPRERELYKHVRLRFYEPYQMIEWDRFQEICRNVTELCDIQLSPNEIWEAIRDLQRVRYAMKTRLSMMEKGRELRGRIRGILDHEPPPQPSNEEFNIANAIGAINYLLNRLDALELKYQFSTGH